MGKFIIFWWIQLKFRFWLYKKRWHTSWKFQLEISSNKMLSPKSVWQTYMKWTVDTIIRKYKKNWQCGIWPWVAKWTSYFRETQSTSTLHPSSFDGMCGIRVISYISFKLKLTFKPHFRCFLRIICRLIQIESNTVTLIREFCIIYDMQLSDTQP